jgi:hypothetical protein
MNRKRNPVQLDLVALPPEQQAAPPFRAQVFEGELVRLVRTEKLRGEKRDFYTQVWIGDTGEYVYKCFTIDNPKMQRRARTSFRALSAAFAATPGFNRATL